jgi:hypothetical protein
MSQELTKYKPPTLQELLDEETMVSRIAQDDLNCILNTQVPASWVKSHPFVKVKNKEGQNIEMPYLPVRKVKYLLKRIFGNYQWQIKYVGQLLNSVYVTGTLTVINPITGETWSQDGCGATQIQMDAGATQGDLSKIKPNAIQIGLPSAESYALKNAAEKFGDIFGGNIMDMDASLYAPVFNEETRKNYQPRNKKPE